MTRRFLQNLFQKKNNHKEPTETAIVEDKEKGEFTIQTERFRKSYDSMDLRSKAMIACIDCDYTYLLYKGQFLARMILEDWGYEWLVDGKWIRSEELTRNFAESKEDFKKISEEEAMKLEEKKESYYLYKERYLAKGKFFGNFVWFLNEQWVEDEELSLGLRDSMMDYGDASPFDYIHISEEWAVKLLLNRTAVLEGRVSSSTNLHKPLIVNLIDWKRPVGEK